MGEKEKFIAKRNTQQSEIKKSYILVSMTSLCPVCNKIVYFAEKSLGPAGKIYHKMCLRCPDCKYGLAGGAWVEHAGTPYCKNCYARRYGPSGFGFGIINQYTK